MAILETLMFGSFSWFLLVVFIVIVFAATLMRKTLGVLMIPLCVVVALTYLDQGLGWHALFMFLTSVFIVTYIVGKKEK